MRRLVVKHLFVSAQTHLWPDFCQKNHFLLATYLQMFQHSLKRWSVAYRPRWLHESRSLRKLDSNFFSRRIFFCFKAVNYWWINRLTLGSVQLYHTQVEDFSLLRQLSC